MADDQANIHSVEFVTSLAGTLTHLSAQMSGVAEKVEADALPRMRRIERAVQHAQEAVFRAERAAANADPEDRRAAEDALQEARDYLTRLKWAMSEVQDAVGRYKAAATEFRSLRSGAIAAAQAYLAERLAGIREYLSIGLDGVSPSGRQVLENAGAADSGTAPQMMDVALPVGFTWVPIADIDVREADGSPLVFKKIDAADMRAGLNAFANDLLPALRRGMALTRDDCRALDVKLGRVSTGLIRVDSVENIYDVFFGKDSVAIGSGTSQRYSVSSGRHRIAIAQELGWTHIPAKWLGG